MATPKKRVDVSSDRTPLSDSPFGNLGAIRDQLPTESPKKAAPQAEIIAPITVSYRVAKTRKGGWPVSFEKRAAGKLVTVIRNISGDGNALLKALRKLCATGGVLKEDFIELQGDHRSRVEAYLSQQLT
tara:strand:- start:471 stop:857 length:387 start_codon:yes stop_codon:yes gene_type:complete